MTTASLSTLHWQTYAGNNDDLISGVLIDLNSYTLIAVTPSGAAVGYSTNRQADGVVVDNIQGASDLTVQIGPITTFVPRYQKANLPITPQTTVVTFQGSNIQPQAYFYTGTFHGETGALNAFASQEAAQVASITGGTTDAYLDTLKWRTNLLLAAGYNLDNLQDSGFFEVLNPTNSGTALPAGEWHIMSFVSSSSNFYCYQCARTVVANNMQTFERRNLSGNGWTAWTQIDAAYAISQANAHSDTNLTMAESYTDNAVAGRAVRYDAAQSLTRTQRTQLQQNIGLATGFGQCQLGMSSATQLSLYPLNGNLLTINGNNETVPSSATITNGGLAATTLYYLYAYMNGTTFSLEFSTTAPSEIGTGIFVKNGDNTRTLVGMVYTDGSGQFQDSSTFRGVASFFNRRPKSMQLVGNGYQTATTSPILAGQQVIMSWGDGLLISIGGYASNNTGGYGTNIQIGLDGALIGFPCSATSAGANQGVAAATSVAFTPGQGAHNVQAYVWVANGGQGTWYVTTDVVPVI